MGDFLVEIKNTPVILPKFLNDKFGNITTSNEFFINAGSYPFSILDISLATGKLHRARLKDSIMSVTTLEEQQLVWDKVVAENIFVVCKTPMAKSITKRTLVGFRKTKVNTRYFEDLINQIKNKPQNFIEKMAKGRSFWKINNDDNMKFNAIVGNPPYQVNDGSGASDDAANPVYHLFVRISKQIDPQYMSLIMPSKWMVGGKVVLKSFRKEMVNDRHLSVMVDYENSGECFNGQHIDGGICYFLWDKMHNDKLEYTYIPGNGNKVKTMRNLSDGNSDIVIRDSRRQTLISKVSKGTLFKQLVSLTQPFGIRKDLFNSPERYPLSKLQAEPFAGCLKIYGVKGIKGGARRTIGYIYPQIVTKNKGILDKYKLFFTTSYSADAVNPPETIEGEPKSVCTETFLLIGPFDTEQEQKNCHKYILTNFFKVLLFFGRGTMQVSQDVFRFIPLQDFTSNGNIDWSKSISEIDQKLYAKYHLTDEEKAFIEQIINSM